MACLIVRSRLLSSYLSPSFTASFRLLHNTRATQNYWEPDRKSGYNTKLEPKPIKFKEGLKDIKDEVDKFKDEWIRKLRCDNAFPIQHGDYEVTWKFDAKSIVDSWVCTSDKDHNEGKSTCSFVVGEHKKGIFHGQLSTEIPKDGIIKNSGYCNIRSPSNLISFKRTRPYEWSDYTHLVMRVRGDGRPYQVVVNMLREFDLQWNDQYTYPLFTRGGPYWQVAKIPFSKFFLSAKGRVQDKQEAIQLDKVLNIGITIADGVPGPFELHIDYVAVLFDLSHKETFEYEMYQVSPYLLA